MKIKEDSYIFVQFSANSKAQKELAREKVNIRKASG
jgi:hypothetical protein